MGNWHPKFVNNLPNPTKFSITIKPKKKHTITKQQPPTPTTTTTTTDRSSSTTFCEVVSSKGQIVTPNLKIFTYAELKGATKNFRPASILGEGGFGQVFKGWLDGVTYAPSKGGVGIPVAVKKSDSDSFQGLKEWQEIHGHKRTIHPNSKKLNALFFKRDKIQWATFAKKVEAAQQGFLGEPNEMKTGGGEFHEYPSTCICKKPFKFSDLNSNYNVNQTLTKLSFNPEATSEYEEDQGVHYLQSIENSGMIGNHESSSKEKDGVDFLIVNHV